MTLPHRSGRAERLEAIFDEAIELEGEERSAYLDRACGEDVELRSETEALLHAFDTHAADVAGLLEKLPLAARRPSDGRDTERGQAGRTGQHVAQYQIKEKLGGGGMGEVYRAIDTKLGRAVALKFLPQHLNEDSEAEARFLHEAKTASALDHANICTIHDIGETEDGELFIAMAYYEGVTIEEKIAEGPLPIHEVIDYAMQTARGLDKAHAAEIVHRDIKPANLLVTPDGVVKILDFGVAKMAGVNLTQTGATVGTATHMSPEQLRGDGVDHRTDLWSFGVVLYEMLTSTQPFSGEHVHAVMFSILYDEPSPVNALREDVPAGLERIVARALEKNPYKRYPHFDDVLSDLRSLSRELAPIPLRSQHRRRARTNRRRLSRYATGVLLLIALMAGGRYLFGERPLSTTQIKAIAVLPVQNLSQDLEQEYFAVGMHEALIAALAQISALRVISRTSAMRYRDTEKSISEIARELNVDQLIEASVYRAGGDVRIQVRLIQAFPEERHLWTQAFSRKEEDVLKIHSDVASAVARQLDVTPSPNESARLAEVGSINVETYEDYLRGMFYLNRSTPEDHERGMAYLRRAVERDPADPLAYTGLALGYITLGHGPASPPGSWQFARAAVDRALRLDSTLAEAWAASADIKLYHDWDWEGAERAFRRANELNPSLAMNHYHYAWYLILMRRVEEALREHRRAQELDPLTPLHTVWMPGVYLYSGQYEKAYEEAVRIGRQYPDHAAALFVLGTSAAQVGKFDEAVAAHEKMVAVNEAWKFALGRTYALAGRTDEARAILADLEAQPPTSWRAIGLADLHAALGNEDEAFRALMFEPPHGWLPWSRVNPALEHVRDDPRFDALLRRLNLPDRRSQAGTR